MQRRHVGICFASLAFAVTVPMLGCGTVPAGIIGDILNGNDNQAIGDLVELGVYATNTGGASGIALRPSDGALFAVNKDGLFGPIENGDDLSTMTPIGATNLADMSVFDQETDNLVLAITNSGEFWIGSNCCSLLAVVPPEGGDAAPFNQFIEANESQAVKPESMAIIPEGFSGPQMKPGDLLLGQETDFNQLVAIDVEGDHAIELVVNPDDSDPPLQREAHHLTFGLDGKLYSSRGLAGLTLFGIQTIDTDGQPTNLPGTLGVSAHSFVALESGDLIIRGTHSRSARPEDQDNGMLIYSAADQSIAFALSLPDGEISEDDEMIITPDGTTIFMSLPQRNEIVRAIDRR